jgi:hypothetical protein
MKFPSRSSKVSSRRSAQVRLGSSKPRRGRLGRGRQLVGHEHLEARRVMAVEVFSQVSDGAITNGWVTIIANNGDDVYAQRAATKDGALLVASNASFLSAQTVPGIDAYADVFVTQATRVNVIDQEADQYPLLPFPAAPGTANRTLHVANGDDIDTLSPIAGIINNGVGGRWSFSPTAGFAVGLEFNDVAAPNYVDLTDLLPNGTASVGPRPLRLSASSPDTSTTIFNIQWDSVLIGGAGNFDKESPPQLESITFDTAFGFAPGFPPTNIAISTSYTNVLASSAARPQFTLPVGSGSAFGEIVPGTLSGVFQADLGGGLTERFQFQTQTQQVGVGGLSDVMPLVFRRINAVGQPLGTYSLSVTVNGGASSRTVIGTLNPLLGIIQLDVSGGGASVPVGPITMESASFARFDHSLLVSDFTLFNGHDFVPSLTVDLLAPGARAAIESPIVAAPFVDLRATTVQIDSRVSSKTTLTVGESQFGIPLDPDIASSLPFSIVNEAGTPVAGGRVMKFTGLSDVQLAMAIDLRPGTPIMLRPTDGVHAGANLVRRVVSVFVAGSDMSVTLNAPLDSSATVGNFFHGVTLAGDPAVARTSAEQAIFNAATAAKVFDIRLEDAVETTAVPRSKFFVSATGSLAGALPTSGAVSDTPFDTLFVRAHTGDVLVEGTVNGTQQSYIMQSPKEGLDGGNHRGPYYFSTRSLQSGGDTGLIKGGTVAITLGNDVPSLYDDTDNGGASSFNIVTLQTEVTSLRVQAADRSGNPQQTPFPYDMFIRENDDLAVDAVAASSLPISIVAGGAIDFRASLASASDVSVEAGKVMELNAPLSTAFGSIALKGQSLTIGNSVRVLDGLPDDRRTDVSLAATNGNLKIFGLVSGLNSIELSQAGVGSITGVSRLIADSLVFDATGSVSVGTDVRLVRGRAEQGVNLDEADTAYMDITSRGVVSLTANGTDVEMASDDLAAHMDRNDSVAADVLVTSPTTFTLPATFAGLQSLSKGMAVSHGSIAVAPGPVAATVFDIGSPDANGRITITITGGTTTAAAGQEISVTFGAVAQFTSGSLIITPVGMPTSQLYIGQQVVSDKLPVGTRIMGINEITGALTLSAAASGGGVAAVRFVEPVALWGVVRDAGNLVLSAPRGSIDIFVPTSDNFVLGDTTKLANGTATSMRAAGTVTIRSLGGSIDVLDAPVGGGAATPVRAVATTSLGNGLIYSQRTPGTFPSTLESDVIGPLVIDGVAVMTRDRVLVAGQEGIYANQNGAYVVVEPGSASSKWKLARLAEFDTTAEMAVQTRFVANQGTDNAGRVFALSRYANVAGTTRVATQAVPNRYGAYPVDAVSTTGLTGATYNGSDVIESSLPGALPATAFDGVSLDAGDYVLVRLGVGATADFAANGVYKVVDAGGASTLWKLERVPSSDFDLTNGGYVVVDQGSLRSRITGNCYYVAYDSLGVVGMTIADVSNRSTTEIGTDNFNELVTYVVSSNAGTNLAAGSLGKMLLLHQRNIAADAVRPADPQKSAFRFGNNVSEIVLTQQLPEIVRPVTIDGAAPRYPIRLTSSPLAINGSQIRQSRGGEPITVADRIHGLEVTKGGASGTKIASLPMYGFSRGAAVRVNADNQLLSGVVVDRMLLGRDGRGRRFANAVGILVEGNVGNHSTISRNQVFSSLEAGIRVTGGTNSDGVRMVGNEVGRVGFENAIGIEVNAGAARQNRIGLISPGVSVSRVPAVRGDTGSELLLTLSANSALWPNLHVGIGLLSSGIQLNTGVAAATVSSLVLVPGVPNDIDPAKRLPRMRVGFTGGQIPIDRPSLTADFGVFAAFTADEATISGPVGLPVLNGNDYTAFELEAIFVGQAVSSTALPAGTVISSIGRNASTGLLEITFSKPALRTAVAAVTLTAAGRNTVASNIRGIVLGEGATKIVATDVINSVMDGITVNGGAAERHIGVAAVQRYGVGAGDVRTSAKDIIADSNKVYGNARRGILVASGVSEATVKIQGNILGSDGSRNLLRNRGGNVAFDKWTPPTQPSVTGNFATEVNTDPNAPGTVKVTVTFVPPEQPHGLPTGRKVYVAGSSFGSAAIGAYTVTRLNVTQFSFIANASAFTAASGTLRFEKYGPAASLPLTNNIDSEGNLHGSIVEPLSGGGPSTGGISAGRPMQPPPRRR